MLQALLFFLLPHEAIVAAVRAGPVQCGRGIADVPVSLSTVVAGQEQELRLEAPGSNFDVSSMHYIHFVPDDGSFEETGCGGDPPCGGTCRAAAQAMAEVPIWSRVQIAHPGWYATCYCEVTGITGCQV